MIWVFPIVSVVYWTAVACDIATTIGALARRAGVESNLDFVGPDGRVQYRKNVIRSLVIWGIGAGLAIALPDPLGLIGSIVIAMRAGARFANAFHNHHLGR